MAELKSLTNHELHQKMKELVVEERRQTHTFLRYLAEIDKRKLHLRYAYPSLFEYMTKALEYSAGAAQRRIDAARIIQLVPGVGEKIEKGKINLSQITQLQGICRQIKRDSGKKVKVEIQKRVLQKLENKNFRETQLILSREFDTEIKIQEKKRIQKDESVRFEFTFSKIEMDLIVKAQDLLSHKTGGSLKQTILEMAKKTVESGGMHKIEMASGPMELIFDKNVHLGHDSNSTDNLASLPTTAATATAASKSISRKMKGQILERDQTCQFKDPLTGKTCGTRFYLEVDHILPRSEGGLNIAENLRILCKNHNIYRYEAGL